MKISSMILSALLSLSAGTAFGQAPAVADPASGAPREVTLRITDRRGRPQAGVVVQRVGRQDASMTDAAGKFVFHGLTDADSIVMMLPRYGEATLPVAGLDSIVVTLRNTRQYTYYTGDAEITDGYTVGRESDRTQAGSLLDVQELLRTTHATSLAELLQGRVAGLSVQRSATGGEVSANIRGQRSFLGSNEPLVVVDGVAVGELSAANQMIDVRMIKSIDVVKEGSMYGSRGANGVIVITTLR